MGGNAGQAGHRIGTCKLKILIDENLDVEFVALFPEHDAHHVIDKGWKAFGNGSFLSLADSESFNVFVTAGKNMPYQQSMKRLGFAITASGRALRLAVHSRKSLSALSVMVSASFYENPKKKNALVSVVQTTIRRNPCLALSFGLAPAGLITPSP